MLDYRGCQITEVVGLQRLSDYRGCWITTLPSPSPLSPPSHSHSPPSPPPTLTTLPLSPSQVHPHVCHCPVYCSQLSTHNHSHWMYKGTTTRPSLSTKDTLAVFLMQQYSKTSILRPPSEAINLGVCMEVYNITKLI